jgi:hypothetical protein
MTKHLQPKLASGGRIEASDLPTEAPVDDITWIVKREQPAKLQPKPRPHRTQKLGDQQCQREWGGEHAAHLY